jgi:hypothetical protein
VGGSARALASVFLVHCIRVMRGDGFD